MSCLVSPHDSVIGWKSDGGLDTIAKDSGRALSLIAVGRDLKPVALDNLRRRVIEIRQVSVLTELENGNYAYVSTAKERRISDEPVTLPAEVTEYQLPTGVAGRFRMEIVDADGVVHCAVPFQVVGKGDANVALEREAELSLQLSKNETLPGEEIEVWLTAPYAGAGLVTIEREKVITSQWFKTDTKATSVRLKIPDDAEGTYYINAAFVRGTSEPEVFHSPLSYAAAPIRVIAAKKKLAFKLDAPEEVRPGTEARFGITSDRPARVVIYAVDEGIHQITAYKLPQPLDFFLRKQALEVRTQQWVDLLLPEYRFLKAAAAFGGDGDGDWRCRCIVILQAPPGTAGRVLVRHRRGGSGTPRGDVGACRTISTETCASWRSGVRRRVIGNARTDTLVKAPIILQPNAPLLLRRAKF